MFSATENASNHLPHTLAAADANNLEIHHPYSPPQAAVPEGNLGGISIRELYPDTIAHQNMISSLEHLMQLIGNPIRTMVAVSELNPCAHSTSIFSTSVLLPNDLAEARNNLSRFHNTLLDIESSLNAPGINRALPEYALCKAALIKAIDSFRKAFETLNDPKKSFDEYVERLTETSRDYSALATAVRLFTDAQREASLASPPGAFKVTAAEAAAQGIHQPPDALRAIIEPEATPIAVAMPIANHIAAQTAKTPKNPHGYPVVKAEIGTPADIEIPADHVVNLMTQDQMEKLIAERNAEITKDHSQIIAP